MSQAIGFQTSIVRDDSYTPSRIAIMAGTGLHDLQEVRIYNLQQPNGWQHIPLRPMDGGEGEPEAEG